MLLDGKIKIKIGGALKNVILAEHEAKELIAKCGIKIPKYDIIKNEDEIDDIKVNFPVALKVSSPKILHKTDVGGVALDIKDKEELKEKFKEMKKRFPGEKFIVEEMAKKGIEVIAGVVNDRAFGKCIMVGIGGIFTEIYKDISFRMLPISKEDAEDMLNDLKAREIFYGYRVKVDKDALIDVLLKLSKMADETKIKQLDLNPIFLYKKGCVAVDAKIILEE